MDFLSIVFIASHKMKEKKRWKFYEFSQLVLCAFWCWMKELSVFHGFRFIWVGVCSRHLFFLGHPKKIQCICDSLSMLVNVFFFIFRLLIAVIAAVDGISFGVPGYFFFFTDFPHLWICVNCTLNIFARTHCFVREEVKNVLCQTTFYCTIKLMSPSSTMDFHINIGYEQTFSLPG